MKLEYEITFRLFGLTPEACCFKWIPVKRFVRCALVISAVLLTPIVLAQAPSKVDCSKMRVTDAASMRDYKLCLASQLEPLDPTRREWYGELYDPKKFVECIKREPLNVGCDRYRLKRIEQPEYWPYAGKVPLAKWPEASKETVYRKGMTPKEYFDALCKAEAGEFIYKTVENVEGIYQVRPRLQASTYELRDRYVMEDPYGYTRWEAETPATLFVDPPFRTYLFFERPKVDPKTGQWIASIIERHSGYIGRREGDKLIQKPMVVEEDTQLKSRYGFTWRGIKRSFDREHGIAGGELIVVDLQNNGVLGIRRGFIHSDIKNRDYKVNWENLTVCPMLQDRPGWPKDGDFTSWFIGKVLTPVKGQQ